MNRSKHNKSNVEYGRYQSHAELRALIDQAEASGISSRSFRQIVEDARRELAAKN